MSIRQISLKFLALLVGLFGFSLPAAAQEAGMGKAYDWQLGFQGAASPVMEEVHSFHNLLLVIIIAIVVVVLALLVYVMVRFNEKANPVPSKNSHNTLIEVIWTAIPILILIVIAIPSFKLLYYMDRTENPDMTIKVVGYQWYWGYEYMDPAIDEYSSYMLREPTKDEEGNILEENDMVAIANRGDEYTRLLSVDAPLVVPVDKNIQVLVTAGDVIHSWALPSFGVKRDAMPGRTNETWFNANRIGTYFGQCSEICGKDHAFMPIEIRVVSQEDFDRWSTIAAEDSVEAANKIVLGINNDQLASAN